MFPPLRSTPRVGSAVPSGAEAAAGRPPRDSPYLSPSYKNGLPASSSASLRPCVRQEDPLLASRFSSLGKRAGTGARLYGNNGIGRHNSPIICVHLRSSGASVKLSLSCDLKGGHHGMTRLPCSPAGRRINMRSATRRCGYFGAVGPPNSLAIAWGRCPQTPEIYRFGPGAWFRRRITVVSRTSICCAYHVNSPPAETGRGTVPICPLQIVRLSRSCGFPTRMRREPGHCVVTICDSAAAITPLTAHTLRL
jgi:hypothetical protein